MNRYYEMVVDFGHRLRAKVKETYEKLSDPSNLIQLIQLMKSGLEYDLSEGRQTINWKRVALSVFLSVTACCRLFFFWYIWDDESTNTDMYGLAPRRWHVPRFVAVFYMASWQIAFLFLTWFMVRENLNLAMIPLRFFLMKRVPFIV